MLQRRKYTDLAFQNPRGIMLQEILKNHWNEWESIYQNYIISAHGPDAEKLRGARDIVVDLIYYIGFCNMNINAFSRKVAEDGYPKWMLGNGGRGKGDRYPDCFLIFDQWFESLLFRMSFKLVT